MKRFVTLAAAALLVTGVSGTATAQGLRAESMLGVAKARAGNMLNVAKAKEAKKTRAQGGTILGPPSFSLMLGGLFANTISAAEGAETLSGYMLRFQTTIPTATQYAVLVAGLQIPVNGLDGSDASDPILFGGPVFLTPALLQGWLLLGLDALAVYGEGFGEQGGGDYGTELFSEFVVIVPFGGKLMPTMASPLSGMALVGLLTQQITGLGEDPDRFAPLILGYLSIPLAPYGGGGS